MGWFDEEEHSTGALTSALADDTRNVQGVSHTKTDTVFHQQVHLPCPTTPKGG